MAEIGASLVGSLGGLQSALRSAASGAAPQAETSFADVLSDALSLFEETGTQSDAATLDLLTGGTEDLSSALISTEKAEIALNLTVAIRNKAVEAYKEIMNMQV